MLESSPVQHHGASFQRYREKAVTADLRAKDRVELARLRAKILQARHARRARALAARAACRDALVRVRERAKVARARLRQEIAEATAAARGQCSTSRVAVAELGVKSVGASKAELARLRADIRLRRRAEGARRLERLTKREQRSESDDEVRNNIPRELEPVWRAVKSHIKGGPRITRTEAFLQWVHDNSASVERIVNKSLESDIEDLVAQEAAMYAQNPRPRMSTSTHARRLTFYRNMITGAARRGDRAAAAGWRAKYKAEAKRPNPRPPARKSKRRNPFVAGGIQGGNLEPGTFVWKRRGIGNPSTIRRAPPGNPNRYASARSGWQALAQLYPKVGDYKRNPGHELERLFTHAQAQHRKGDLAGAIRTLFKADELAAAIRPKTVRVEKMRVVIARAVDALTKQMQRKRAIANPRRRRNPSRRTPAQNRAIALHHLRIAVDLNARGDHRVSAATVRQVAERARRYGATVAEVEAVIAKRYTRKKARRKMNPVTAHDLITDAITSARDRLSKVESLIAKTTATADASGGSSSGGGVATSNPRRRRPRKNPRRPSGGVKWWRATVYGPGGKVMHRQVARANPSTARASAQRLASKHGRVALDGPFAAKPAC